MTAEQENYLLHLVISDTSGNPLQKEVENLLLDQAALRMAKKVLKKVSMSTV